MVPAANRIRVENLSESNVDDLIEVCSSKRLSDPAHAEGVKIKKRWLLEALRKFGPVAKIAYLDNRPVAQILYYPEDSKSSNINKRKGVLEIQCIYNPTPNARKLGIGTKLLTSVIEDAKQGKTCLGKEPCTFIVAKAFNTGESFSLLEFYRKNGFQKTEHEDSMYLQINRTYRHGKLDRKCAPLPEDGNRAVVFYSPRCQFSYHFAVKISEIIREVASNITIDMINEDEAYQEFLKRGGHPLVVNGVPIRSFFMEVEKFREEIRQALHRKP